jgi:histone acetyltransferase MYST2
LGPGYLLSKKEQRLGSPEKPLSGLGALGYKNYWTLSIMRYLHTASEHPTLEGRQFIDLVTIGSDDERT